MVLIKKNSNEHVPYKYFKDFFFKYFVHFRKYLVLNWTPTIFAVIWSNKICYFMLGKNKVVLWKIIANTTTRRSTSTLTLYQWETFALRVVLPWVLYWSTIRLRVENESLSTSYRNFVVYDRLLKILTRNKTCK